MTPTGHQRGLAVPRFAQYDAHYEQAEAERRYHVALCDVGRRRAPDRYYCGCGAARLSTPIPVVQCRQKLLMGG
jgi:hypothetical protein